MQELLVLLKDVLELLVVMVDIELFCQHVCMIADEVVSLESEVPAQDPLLGENVLLLLIGYVGAILHAPVERDSVHR